MLVRRPLLDIVFAAGVSLWLNAIVGAVFRGADDSRFPALVMLASATVQVPLSGALILGWFAIAVVGSTIAVAAVGADTGAIFACVAAGMAAYGVATAGAIAAGAWRRA